jgi:hypothetical protein
VLHKLTQLSGRQLLNDSYQTRLRVGLAVCHRYLTVADLAQGARVLTRDPYRALPLLAQAGIIQHQHAVPQRDVSSHLLHPLAIEVGFVPLHIREKPLQTLYTGPLQTRAAPL